MDRETEDYIEKEVQLRILNYKMGNTYKRDQKLHSKMLFKCNFIIFLLLSKVAYALAVAFKWIS